MRSTAADGGPLPASTILVLESPATADASLVPQLTLAGYTVTQTTDPDEAFSKIVEHQLAILDVGIPDVPAKTAIELCREIRATPAMAAVPILCVANTDDVEERIGFLEAGADDVIARPFDAREVEARVEALLLRFQRSKHKAPVVSSDGLTISQARRVVAVYSPKGGVGTTTIAINIAVVAAQQRPDRVVLVDLDLQFGGVATHLNLDARQTLADIVRDEGVLREPELLRTFAMRHDSGLHVIAAPTTPDGAEFVTADHVMHIIGSLLEQYESVVIDAGSVLDERTMTVFEQAETIVLGVYPEIAALGAMPGLLACLTAGGWIGERAPSVLTNRFPRDLLKPRDTESAMHRLEGGD